MSLISVCTTHSCPDCAQSHVLSIRNHSYSCYERPPRTCLQVLIIETCLKPGKRQNECFRIDLKFRGLQLHLITVECTKLIVNFFLVLCDEFNESTSSIRS